MTRRPRIEFVSVVYHVISRGVHGEAIYQEGGNFVFLLNFCLSFLKLKFKILIMKFIPRLIEPQLLLASREFNDLILTGPRRSGKTTLLRKLFPRASYHLLEHPM